MHTPNSQGQDFSWQTKGVCTDGRFGGGGEWRWISEVIRDDILLSLQQRQSPSLQGTACFQGKNVREDPCRFDALNPTMLFFSETDGWRLADTESSHTDRNMKVSDQQGSGWIETGEQRSGEKQTWLRLPAGGTFCFEKQLIVSASHDN